MTAIDQASALWWPAPAKINRFLHITGRRADGYHELQTVFQFLELGDYLYFSPDSRLRLHCPQLPDVAPEQNLVWRAARLLQQETGCQQGCYIELDKRLPHGGGLGGGSSDAATTLLALNQLWQTGLNRPQLAKLGLQLGADVPVFIAGEACWAEGVGEKMRPVSLSEPWVVLLDPGCQVPTAAIFGDPDLTRNSVPLQWAAFIEGTGRNDCQTVAARRFPQVGEALRWLSQFGSARMTGTGACVFALFASRDYAQRVAAQAPEKMQAWVTQAKIFRRLWTT